jgi:hypothetical protein
MEGRSPWRVLLRVVVVWMRLRRSMSMPTLLYIMDELVFLRMSEMTFCLIVVLLDCL